MDREGILNKPLTESLDSGEYYRVAMEWYTHRYLAYMRDKVVFFYYTLTAMIASFISVSSIHTLYPIHQDFPILSSNSDPHNITTVIAVEQEGDSNPAVSLARYLAEQYVLHRENYSFEKIRENRAYILNLSASSARLQYEAQYMDLHNPNSMLLQYQRSGYRTPTIRNIRLVSNYDGEPYKAIATVNIRENVPNIGERLFCILVSLRFDMPNLNLVYTGYLPFSFRVHEYESTVTTCPKTRAK